MNYKFLFFTAVVTLALQACVEKSRYAATQNAVGTMAELKGSCPNPLSMKPQTGEVEIKLSDLVTGQPGSYQLVSTEYFSAVETADGSVNNLNFLGSEFKTDTDLKDQVTADDKLEILCSTPADQKSTKALQLTGSLDVPNGFDTDDGAIHAYRHDEVTIDNGTQKMISVVFPREEKVRSSDEKLPDGLKILVVKKDNSEVTMKMQYDSVTREQKRMSYIVSATYRLQKN